MWPLIFLAVELFIIAGVSGDSNLAEECQKKATCGDCIQTSPECGWCEDANYFWGGQPSPRCNELELHRKKYCKKIANPTSNSNTSTDAPLDDKLKVSPQNLTLNLRPGQPTTFKVKVRMPENYPVDLYYLMDMSGSMREDIDKIKVLGQKMASEMGSITKSFRLGFGAFVDKPVAPYIDTYPTKLAHPEPSNPNSVPAFGFKNFLPLSPDPKDFENTVASLNISGNVDNPEGGLDALMQVAVCEQQIGWKDKLEARRLVIFTTDSGYHFAGDGLLGGIVTPNDGRCHLIGDTYSATTTLDYPSVGTLRETLLKNQVAPIFAITKTQVGIYEHLVAFFGNETGAVARRLNNDSSNVVPLIREAYLRIARTQTVTDNAPDGIDVKYTANCPDGKREGENTCTDVNIGEEVSFDVSVTAKDCKKKAPGFSLKTAFGDIDISLKYICDCQCETLENQIEKSADCNTNGTLICGDCKCNEESGGRVCQCPATDQFDDTRCTQGKNATTEVCSGRGLCNCGECECYKSKTKGEIIYGKNCECTNMDCPRDPISLLPCGGPAHGICDCGTCNCTGNWTGPDCMCTKSNATCINDGVLCSGRGVCECGKCVCNATSPYRGPFCDDCPSCEGKCRSNRDCVECVKFGTGKLSRAECNAKCSNIKFEMVDKITQDTKGTRCSFKDQDDCNLIFTYRDDEDKQLLIVVQKERECPEEAEALAVILGVVGGVLGVGLALLLIWKLLATIQDRREFAKFEKERQNAKWDTGENPIFKQATTTFQNPTYGGK